MSAARHTPGPWEHTTRPDTGGDSRPVVTRGADLVCAVSRRDGQTGEAEANAYLIAAAPDLLAACEATLKMLDSNADENGPDRWLLLRNAIAKARGGA